MYQIKDPVTGFWKRVPEPRGASVWQTFTYLGIAFAGLMGALHPPMSLVEQLSPWALTYWGLLLSFGGATGALAVLPGQFWLERIAIVSVAFGIVIYGVGLWAAWASDLFAHPNSAWPWLGFLFSILANMGTRWSRVKHGMKDPERFSTYGQPQ